MNGKRGDTQTRSLKRSVQKTAKHHLQSVSFIIKYMLFEQFVVWINVLFLMNLFDKDSKYQK